MVITMRDFSFKKRRGRYPRDSRSEMIAGILNSFTGKCSGCGATVVAPSNWDKYSDEILSMADCESHISQYLRLVKGSSVVLDAYLQFIDGLLDRVKMFGYSPVFNNLKGIHLR